MLNTNSMYFMDKYLFLLADSGEVCPEAGRWISNGDVPETRNFHYGEFFPTVAGKPVRWRLLLAI
jgi:hypothetical protein